VLDFTVYIQIDFLCPSAEWIMILDKPDQAPLH